jgi:hypothetical protein
VPSRLACAGISSGRGGADGAGDTARSAAIGDGAEGCVVSGSAARADGGGREDGTGV